MTDGPEADGCDLDFTQHADDPDTVALRALFPTGEPDPARAAEWRQLFGGDQR